MAIIPELYYFLPFIIFLGIITSYQDLRFGKIKNMWIIVSILYAALYYFSVIYLDIFGNLDIGNYSYLAEYSLMAVISLIIGFIIYSVGLWTAGDAKLFFAYTLLIPLSIYSFGRIPFFSFTNILINTFTPIFIFLTFFMLFKTNLKYKIFYLKKAFEPKLIFSLLLFLFGFIYIINLLFSLIGIVPDFFTSIIFLFLFMLVIERLFPVKMTNIVIVISIIRILFDESALTIQSLQFLFFNWMLFILLRFFILYMGFGLLTKQVDIKLLKKGMVPAEKVYLENGEYKKESILHFSFFSYLYDNTKKRNYLFEPSPEGLTENDVEKIKKKEKDLKFEHLRIHKTLSFAPFLFAGVLLTIVFKGNMFISISVLIQSLF